MHSKLFVGRNQLLGENMKEKILLLLGCIVIAGCQTTGQNLTTTQSQTSEVPKEYTSWIGCVDQSATLFSQSNPNATPQDQIVTGMNSCKSELDGYLDVLIDKIKLDNGWSSVRPPVRPAIRESVKTSTLQMMLPAYR
jgi:hypothetical protein